MRRDPQHRPDRRDDGPKRKDHAPIDDAAEQRSAPAAAVACGLAGLPWLRFLFAAPHAGTRLVLLGDAGFLAARRRAARAVAFLGRRPGRPITAGQPETHSGHRERVETGLAAPLRLSPSRAHSVLVPRMMRRAAPTRYRKV